MEIQLPADVEALVQVEVQSGHFASADELVAAAVRHYVGQGMEPSKRPAAAGGSATPPPRRRIWEVAAELRASVPEEEWAKLPPDGAEQHDHYIYGTPKRPMT